MLCVETDERQHLSYDKTDEKNRYDDLVMIFSGKWIFIRFNPDSYIVNKKKYNPKYVILMENINEEIQLVSNEKNLILPHYNQSTDVRTIEYMSPDNLNWLKYKFYKEDHKLYDNYKNMNVSKRLNL